jgi:hypothetical protein
MKMNPWLLPGAALLVTGGWITCGKQSAATLEREINVLTERIQQVKAVGYDESNAASTDKESLKAKDGKIHWKELSGKIVETRGGSGIGDMRTIMRVQRTLMEMSAEELATQLEEIAALDIDDRTKEQLQGMLLGALAEKDHKMVIERFAGKTVRENTATHWSVQVALGKWVEKEPAAAVAWMDKQIAEGRFESRSLDGKSQERIRFEGILVAEFLKKDPAMASARVAGLPEDQREDLFKQGIAYNMPTENESSYIKLVRDSLPSDKVGGILAQTAGHLVQIRGYERGDGFIANAMATDEEKNAIVAQVMKQKLSYLEGSEINVEDMDKARAWGATHSPSAVDTATGQALANTLWRGGDFKTASELVLKYKTKSGNDVVLAAFLKSDAVQLSAANDAKALIGQIKDPKLREEIRALPKYQ